MIPHRFVPLLFGLLLSGTMSLIVSAVATLRAIGLTPAFVDVWIGAWLTAWLVAFPVVLVAAPLTRRAVLRLVQPAPTLGVSHDGTVSTESPVRKSRKS